MKRTIVLIAVSLCGIGSRAQIWCAPGADWYWSQSGVSFERYVHRQYVGDTLVGGIAAQKIQETGYHINYFTMDTVAIDSMRLTAVVGDDVLLWVRYDDVWQWDTLYRFGVGPGAMWHPAGMYDGPSGCLVQVLDTSTTSFAGASVKLITVESLHPDSTPAGWIFSFASRVGYVYGMWTLGNMCSSNPPEENLRCYSDVAVNYADTNWHFGCDSEVSLAERKKIDTRLFPNPGTDHFILTLPPGPHTITLIDATGRILGQQRTSDERATIATACLPSGIYLVRIDGSPVPLRWVKN